MYSLYTILLLFGVAIALLWSLVRSLCETNAFRKLGFLIIGLVPTCIGICLLIFSFATMPSLFGSGYIGSCELTSTYMTDIYENGYNLGFKSPSVKGEIENLVLPDHSTYYDTISVISKERFISPVTYVRHIVGVGINKFSETNVDDVASLGVNRVSHTSTLTATGEIKQATKDGKSIFTIDDTELVGNDEKNSIGLLVNNGVKELHIVYDNTKPSISRYLIVSVKEIDK